MTLIKHFILRHDLLKFIIFNVIVSFLWLGENYLFLKEFYVVNGIYAVISLSILLWCCYFLISLIIYRFSQCCLVLNCIFFLIAGTLNYFKLHYKIIISSTLIQSIIHTDAQETLELLNVSLFSYFILFSIVPCVIIIFLQKVLYCSKIYARWYLGAFLGVIVGVILSCAILPSKTYTTKFLVDSLTSFMPFNYIIAQKNYWNFYRSTSNTAKDITQYFNFAVSNKISKKVNVVLVIGESSRADRWGINGYKRNTTPNLSKLNNLITFENVYSLATNTPLGVYNIMKRNDYYDFSSFVTVFKSLGFNTYWFSNQGVKYELINSIAKESDTHLFSDDLRLSKMGSNYDMDLLPFVKEVLNSQDSTSNIIVLHTIGSHRLYDLRYPQEFKVFTPTCVSDNTLYYSVNECVDVEKLGNSYDNSILYTDYFLNSLVHMLKDQNAILIYVSDHGESLGENGIYAHSYPFEVAPVEQRHIPLIMWASDKFLEDKANLVKFNNARKKSNIEIDQSNVFHSILDCSRIESDGIDLYKSLCSDKW